MAPNTKYVPVLKSKKGELEALEKTSPETKEQMTPIVEVLRPAASKKTLEEHLITVAENILGSWPKGRPFFIDLDLDPTARAGGRHPFGLVCSELLQQGASLIPCTSLDRDDEFIDSLLETFDVEESGLCLRLIWDDLNDPAALFLAIDDLAESFAITFEKLHINIDLRSIDDERTVEDISQRVIQGISGMRGVDSFASVILTGSSLPESFSFCKKGTCTRIPRKELLVWREVTQSYPVIFGDYGTVHPEYRDFTTEELARMKPGAKIRYTEDENWLVLKGGYWATKPSPFIQLAGTMSGMSEFFGAEFSWGDNRIVETSRNLNKPAKSLAEWVAIDMNHHLTVTAKQTSNPSGS